MGLHSNEQGGYATKKARYQPPESNLLSKIKDVGFRIQSYHLLVNEEDPGTNHLIADVDLGSSKPNRQMHIPDSLYFFTRFILVCRVA